MEIPPGLPLRKGDDTPASESIIHAGNPGKGAGMSLPEKRGPLALTGEGAARGTGESRYTFTLTKGSSWMPTFGLISNLISSVPWRFTPPSLDTSSRLTTRRSIWPVSSTVS